MPKAPEPPSTLARRGAALWRRTLAEAEFSASEQALLEALCQAFDTWSAAAQIVKSEGPVTVDRFGAPRAHPAVMIAKDCAATMARLGGQLDLELDEDLGPAVRHPHRSKPGPRR